jgi:beta-N-acetylhexosaminidase
VALAAVIIAGCVGSTSPSEALLSSLSPSPTLTPDPTATPLVVSPTPVPSTPTLATQSPATPAPAPLSCAVQELDAMSEAQRIGQLFMIGLTGNQLDATERQAIAAFHFGSVLFTKRTAVGVAAVRAVSNAVQAQATLSATRGVLFFIAANQEGGLVQALSGPGFDVIPSALDQGALSLAQLTALATRWGRQLRAAGLNLDLAPVADVVPPGTDARNAPIGQLDREFGHDPSSVASHVAAFIAGMRASGVGTTAKHFPGLGRVVGNTDFTASVVDSVTIRHDPYLLPFAQAIMAGVPFVMVSLATYDRIDPTHLAAFSNTVINRMLRGDLGFGGVVISDSLGATAVESLPLGTRAIDFLDAGGDMIVLNQPSQAITMARVVASFASAHAWFRARIYNAAWHVLRAKEAAGLLQCSEPGHAG